jgi:hypothetical protein
MSSRWLAQVEGRGNRFTLTVGQRVIEVQERWRGPGREGIASERDVRREYARERVRDTLELDSGEEEA